MNTIRPQSKEQLQVKEVESHETRTDKSKEEFPAERPKEIDKPQTKTSPDSTNR